MRPGSRLTLWQHDSYYEIFKSREPLPVQVLCCVILLA